MTWTRDDPRRAPLPPRIPVTTTVKATRVQPPPTRVSDPPSPPGSARCRRARAVPYGAPAPVRAPRSADPARARAAPPSRRSRGVVRPASGVGAGRRRARHRARRSLFRRGKPAPQTGRGHHADTRERPRPLPFAAAPRGEERFREARRSAPTPPRLDPPPLQSPDPRKARITLQPPQGRTITGAPGAAPISWHTPAAQSVQPAPVAPEDASASSGTGGRSGVQR